MRKLENKILPENINYSDIKNLRQNRVYKDKKEQRKQEISKNQKRQVHPCFFYSKQAVIRPRGQNAYQQDKDLQEQTKNSIQQTAFVYLDIEFYEKRKDF